MNRKMDWGEEPEFFGPRHYYRESLMLRGLRHHVPKHGTVLDAGSGSGSMSIRIGKAGYRNVLGIDNSSAFVAYAGRRAEEERLSSVVGFREGDLMALAINDKSFDAIVAGEVLEHIEDDMYVVMEFFRVLKEGGFCIVTVPANPRLWDRNDEWAGHCRRYERAHLRQMFEDAGFEVLRCTHWGFPLVRLFHKYVYLPMVERKILKERKNISQEYNTLFRWLKNGCLHRAGAVLFSFDNFFNFLPFGLGLLLIARKP
jgi:2-polyprenyl-3-methyl-5-hydroxy-6-metoxy-1,4-benzoquinol methylase